MSTQKHLGIRDEDLVGKRYAKYWNPEMGPLPIHVQEAIAHGPQAAELGFEFEAVDQLLSPGYLPLETGYTRLKSGQLFVATLTQLPGVKADMIDWWFGWHSMETQRYKLWHPRAHLAVRSEKMNGDDPELSDREKYLDNPNYVSEYMGPEASDIIITFCQPSQFFDADRFRESNTGTAICGNIGYQNLPARFGRLIHLIRETAEGCEMRSRFWLGNIGSESALVKRLLRRTIGSSTALKRILPMTTGRDLAVHCAAEMNHLGSFLPQLYRDYH